MQRLGDAVVGSAFSLHRRLSFLVCVRGARYKAPPLAAKPGGTHIRHANDVELNRSIVASAEHASRGNGHEIEWRCRMYARFWFRGRSYFRISLRAAAPSSI